MLVLRDITALAAANRAVEEQVRAVQLYQTVVSAANDAPSMKTALGDSIESICAATGWRCWDGTR